MSLEDGDADVTIDNSDVSGVEGAMTALLDNVQSNLAFPYTTDADTASSQTASATLNYRFSADISVSLDTDWEIVDGLNLTNIILYAAIAKSRLRSGKESTEMDGKVTGLMQKIPSSEHGSAPVGFG